MHFNTTFPNTKNRVDNSNMNDLHWSIFENFSLVFRNAAMHCVECLPACMCNQLKFIITLEAENRGIQIHCIAKSLI